MDEITDPETLKPGDQVPHFEVRRVDGSVFNYRTVWQHKNLLVIALPASSCDDGYVPGLRARKSEFHQLETECVITREAIAGLPAPGVILADRWGEIIHIISASESAAMPTPDDLLGWLEHIQNRCPECEGESR